MTRASGLVVDTRASVAVCPSAAACRLDGRQLRERFLDAGHAVRGARCWAASARALTGVSACFWTRSTCFRPGADTPPASRRAGTTRPWHCRARRPILGHPRHRDNPALQQGDNRLRQQIVERGLMRDAEITQRVVIHRDSKFSLQAAFFSSLSGELEQRGSARATQ